ncbi:hypothetical protein JET18_12840 [Chryseobacterium sp. L7]|uniref:Bacteriocin n=1 Tax=Chryseobacterium endalhagicum TaxID=2797638 RepID=A0ABS1QGK5_9FLAO|nr:hypothetical protein [Chryseobacterium endalhagicum]MBL1221730.1 hypothetical protein [Chryseobacterium endalhagicum]
MKNLKKLTRENMRSVNGGFACYCGSVYKGEYTSVSACASACGVSTGTTTTTNPSPTTTTTPSTSVFTK